MKKILKRIAIISAVLVLIISAFILFFNRAPARTIPNDNVIVSPASGKIIGIVPTDQPVITFDKKGITNTVTVPELQQPATMVIIEMNPLDVHVQRAPIPGLITQMTHYPGKHINALGSQKLEIMNLNEKTVTVFKNDQESVGVIQVAGRAARRIRNFIDPGQNVAKGDIYGRIILGSQVVVIIPQERIVQVNLDQKVVDGETILAK